MRIRYTFNLKKKISDCLVRGYKDLHNIYIYGFNSGGAYSTAKCLERKNICRRQGYDRREVMQILYSGAICTEFTIPPTSRCVIMQKSL